MTDSNASCGFFQGLDKIAALFPTLGKKHQRHGSLTLPLRFPIALALVGSLLLTTVRAQVVATPYANELSRFEREVRNLPVTVQVQPDPVELSPAAPGKPASGAAYAEVRISDEARDRLNERIAALAAAAAGITPDGLADVHIIETCRWTVNGMAWGAPLARRVTEVTPVLGRASLQFNRPGNAKVEAEIEWRVELRRAVRSGAAGAGPRVWSWMPWSLDLPLSDPRQVVSPMATRMFLSQGAATVAVAAPAPRSYPATIRIQGPARAYAGAEVVLQAFLSIAQPGPEVRIEWMAGKNVVAIGDTLKLTPGMPGPRHFVIRAVAMRPGGRTILAQQKHVLDVLPPAGEPKVAVRISGGGEAKTGEVIVLSASLSGINRAGSYAVPEARIVWASQGRVLHEGRRLALSSDVAGALEIVAMAERREGKRRIILETARQTVTFAGTPTPVVEKPVVVAPKPEPAVPRIDPAKAAREAAARELAEREAAQKAEADRQAKLRAEQEAAAQAEAARAAELKAEEEAAARAEIERQAKMRAEQEAAAKAEAARQAQLKAEQEAAEKAAREAAEKAEAERQAKLRAEEEAAAQAEIERQAKMRAEREAAEKAEAERQAQLKAEQEAAARAEAARQAQLKAEAEAAEKAAREAAVRAEQEAAAKAEAERAVQLKAEEEAAARAESERQAQIKAEQEAAEKAAREAAEKAEAERQAKIKAEQEAAAKAEAERQAQLKAEQEAAEKAAREAAAKAEAERQAQLKAEQEAAEKAAREAAEKAEAERQAQIKAEQEAAAKAEAERQARLKAEAEAAAKAEAERQAQLKAEQEAAAKAEAERQARIKAEQEAAAKAEAERLAKLKAEQEAEEAAARARAAEALQKFEEAKALAADGKLDEAVAAAEAAVQLDVTLFEASSQADRWTAEKKELSELVAVARAAIAKSDSKSASAALAKAEKLNPHYPPLAEVAAELAGLKELLAHAKAEVAAGREAENAGDLKGALARYEAAHQMVPDAAVAKRIVDVKAQIEQHEKELKAAMEAAAKAASLADEARKREEAGDYKAAIAGYEASLAAQADPAVAARLKAAKAKQAEIEAAEKAAREAAAEAERQAKKRAKQAADLVDEAHKLEAAGNYPGAIAKLAESMELSPNAKISAEIELLRTKQAAAESAAADARARAAKARAAMDLADGLAAEGQLDEAIAKMREAAALDGSQAEAAALAKQWSDEKQAVIEQIVVARAAMEAWDYEKALAALQKAQEKHPRYAPVLDLQIEVAGMKKQLDEARALATAAAALEKKGDLDTALLKYEAALAVVPNADWAAAVKAVKEKQAAAILAGQAAAEKAEAERLAKLKAEEEAAAKAEAERQAQLKAEQEAAEKAAREAAEKAEAERQAALKAEQEAAAARAEAERQAKLKAEAEQKLGLGVEQAAAEARSALAQYDIEAAAVAMDKIRALDSAAPSLAELERELVAAQQKVDASQAAIKEGYALESKGDLAGAMAKYEAAHALVPDDVLIARVTELQQRIAREAAAKAEAEKQARLKAEKEAAEKAARAALEREAAAKAEAERQAKLKAEKEAAEKAAREEEARRVLEQEAAAKAEAERQAKVKAEQEAARVAAEKAAREKEAQALLEREAKAKAEQEAAAKAAAEKQKAEVEAAAKAMLSNRQAAEDKLAQARAMVAEGRLEDGSVLAAEAARLDPDLAEAEKLAVQWTSERRTVMEHVVQSRTWMAKYDVKKATIAWQAAKRMHPRYQPVVELGIDLEKLRRNVDQAQSDINDGYALEKAGDLAGAMAKYESALALVPDAKISSRLAVLRAKQVEADAQRLVNEGYLLEQQGDIAGAVARYEEALKLAADEGLAARVAELKAQVAEPQ